MCYVQDKFATDMARINSGEVQGVLVQQMKPPAKDGEVKKKSIISKVDGIQSTLCNPFPEKFGELQIIHSMKDTFKQF